MTTTSTPEEARERRRGWLTLIAVAVIAVVLFAAFWAIQVVLYLRSDTEIG